MRKFKVLQARQSDMVLLAEFHDRDAAVDLADRVKYMRPIVYIDDGTVPLSALTLSQALAHSIRVVGHTPNVD